MFYGYCYPFHYLLYPMKNYAAVLTLLIIASCTQSDSHYVSYENGLWFDGVDFVEQTLYSKDGIFTDHRPSRIDTTYNLSGNFIIPPFGDAHTHELGDSASLKEMLPRFIEDGIFYVQVLNNHASKIADFRYDFKSANTIDVLYANGGLTASLGHPFVAFETSAMGLHWSAMFTQREKIMKSRLAENDAYWFLDSPEDVSEKWEQIKASNPDLIKIFLLNTSDHDELFNTGNMGNFGLSEETAAAVVAKARESGLRVVAHADTADDFRVGLDIGDDGFGHIPGYLWDGEADTEKFRLTDDDLARAAKQDVFVTPTANFARVYATSFESDGTQTTDEDRMEMVNRFLSEELERFHQAGIRIAIGADQHRETAMLELDYLYKNLEAFDAATLLEIGTYTTPTAIFPERNIGKFKIGYEASFLALEGNPLEDRAFLRSITLRVKQGEMLK